MLKFPISSDITQHKIEIYYLQIQSSLLSNHSDYIMILYIFPYFTIQLYQICPLSKQYQNCPAEQLHRAILIMLNLTVVNFDTMQSVFMPSYVSKPLPNRYKHIPILQSAHKATRLIRFLTYKTSFPCILRCHFYFLLFSIPEVTMIA